MARTVYKNSRPFFNGEHGEISLVILFRNKPSMGSDAQLAYGFALTYKGKSGYINVHLKADYMSQV